MKTVRASSKGAEYVRPSVVVETHIVVGQRWKFVAAPAHLSQPCMSAEPHIAHAAARSGGLIVLRVRLLLMLLLSLIVVLLDGACGRLLGVGLWTLHRGVLSSA